VIGQLWLREMALDRPEAVQVPIEASLPFLAMRAANQATGMPDGPAHAVHGFAAMYDAAGSLASEGLRLGYLYEEAESEAFLAFDMARFDMAGRLYAACRHIAAIDVGLTGRSKRVLAAALAGGIAVGGKSRGGSLSEGAVATAAHEAAAADRTARSAGTDDDVAASRVSDSASQVDDRPPPGLEGAAALVGANSVATAGTIAAARRIIS